MEIEYREIEIRTSEYVFNHGHEPGRCRECSGRGKWAFGVPVHLGRVHPETIVWFEGTFAEVKKLATRYARKVGVRWMTVLP